jgi:uncharacterized protein (DUF1697 family)
MGIIVLFRGRVVGRFVALLRGINVGTAKRVAMADLRALVEGLGYTDVATLLNSGNVVFSAMKIDPQKAASRIQRAVEAKLGVSARVMVMSGDELSAIVEADPFGRIADNPSRYLVGILGEPSDREKLTDVIAKSWGEEQIALGKGAASRALFMWIPPGVIESKLNAAVSKALKDGVTARNWSTMTKLLDMTEPGSTK